MYVNAKRMAFLGLLLAVTVILVILGGVLELNTLFFMAAASFGVGIAIRECGLRLGFAFFVASVLLSLMIVPNKFYCITFIAMSLYVLIIEWAWEKLTYVKWCHNKNILLWVVKYLTFNIIYLPMLFVFPKLIYPGTINSYLLLALIVGGQAAVFIYDKAYNYFQSTIWGKFRGRLL